MKKSGIAFLLVVLLLAGCNKIENKEKNVGETKNKDNSEDKIQFIDEPNLEPVPAFEAILKFNFSENSWSIEKSYKGFIDEKGLARRIVARFKDGDGKTTQEETYAIRKTVDGYYCEYRNNNSRGFYLVTDEDRGLIFENYETDPVETSSQASLLIPLVREKYIVMKNDNGEIWKSEYKTASVFGNRYFEKEHVQAEFRKPNYIFQDSCLYLYQDLNPDGQPAFYSDVFEFAYTTDPDSGNTEARLVQWRHNLEADFDTSENWESRSAEIEIKLFRNMHSDDPEINLLNQLLIPEDSEFFIPFLYGLSLKMVETP